MHDREESVCHASGRRAFVTPTTTDVGLVLEQGDRITAPGTSDDDHPAAKAEQGRDEHGRVVPTMWR